MAITKQEVILEVKADTKEVTKSIDNVSTSVEGVSEATSGLTGTLDKMTGGAISAFSGFAGGVKKAVTGLKTFKVALAATGIGLLVVAIGSLVTAFNSSEEGANKLSKILTVVGSVTDNLLDLVADLGEKIIAAFENPQAAFESFKNALVENITNRLEGLIEFLPKIGEAISLVFDGKFGQAAQVAGDAVAKVALGVEDFSEKAAEAVQASVEFGQQLIEEGKIAGNIADQRAKANKLERELLVERATLESEIAQLRLKSRQEDEFSAEVRKQALLDAQALEDQLLAKETEVLTLRRDAQIEENKLARSSVENLDKEAEAIAAVSRQEAARLNQQRSTQRELNRLNKEIERDAKAAQKAEEDKAAAVQKAAEAELAAQQKLEDELYALTLSAQEREELALLQAYDKRIAIAGDDEGLIKAATEQFLEDNDALQAKYADNETKRQQAVAQSRIQLGLGALSALQQLNTAFQKDDEASAKRAFKRNKALSIATATLQTAQAVTAALTAGGNPIKLATGAQFVEAGIAAAMGAAQIATISRQKFSSTSTNPGPSALDTAASNVSVPAIGSSGGGGTSVGAPQLDLGFLGQGQTDVGPVQAYVISQNVTTAQQANQQIAEQAAL
jgi:hypothetical protein